MTRNTIQSAKKRRYSIDFQNVAQVNIVLNITMIVMYFVEKLRHNRELVIKN